MKVFADVKHILSPIMRCMHCAVTLKRVGDSQTYKLNRQNSQERSCLKDFLNRVKNFLMDVIFGEKKFLVKLQDGVYYQVTMPRGKTRTSYSVVFFAFPET